jgi:hypothetical protein
MSDLSDHPADRWMIFLHHGILMVLQAEGPQRGALVVPALDTALDLADS